jgi:hypothetical protein
MAHVRRWIKAGIRPSCAARLVKAGITDLATLALHSREEVLGIPGVHKATLKVCEKLLGYPLPSIYAYWHERGFPPKLAKILHKAGIESTEDLSALCREELIWFLGINPRSVELCEALLGRPLGSAVELWAGLGLRDATARRLVRAHIVSITSLEQRFDDLATRLDIADLRACEEILARRTMPPAEDIRTELKQMRMRLQQMLVSLKTSEGARGPAEDEESLRVIIWSAARELEGV